MNEIETSDFEFLSACRSPKLRCVSRSEGIGIYSPQTQSIYSPREESSPSEERGNVTNIA